MKYNVVYHVLKKGQNVKMSKSRNVGMSK